MEELWTANQVYQYLELIRISGLAIDDATPQSLDTLMTRHLATFPFENLDLHYSQHRTISLDKDVLFDKFVNRKRGGYCMENNLVLYNVLKALGFDVYTAGGRSRERVDGIPCGTWYGWTHMVLIVHFDVPQGMNYASVVDVGFGGDGPIHPIPLIEDRIQKNIGRQEVRYAQMHLNEKHSKHAPKQWIYQVRNGPEKDWMSCYSFSEIEFFPQDFKVMNMYTSQSLGTWTTWRLIVVRFLVEPVQRPEGTRDEVVGKLMLTMDEVRRNMGGKTETIMKVKSETDRIQCLKEFFGIELSPYEIAGIKGLPTELPSV